MKDIIVQKYGGSSIENIEKIKNIAKRIIETKKEGKRVVVVVSAMGDSTDNLMNMANEISSNASPREMDMLISTGEQISISLLTMAIQSMGYDAISLTGAQCGIVTHDNHKNARIESINKERLEAELKKDKIVIVAGFQGQNKSGDIVTLGRGGSDTSAVALAAIIKAKRCEICTDVDGIYTSDPRVVPKAQLLEEISYDEMLELANLGAKVLHPRAVEIARNYNVPLVVRSSFNNNKGTQVKESNDLEKALIRGITLDKDIAKISIIEVPDKPGIAYNLFARLAEEKINVDMIIQNINRNGVNDISFSVHKGDLQEAVKLTKKIGKELEAKDVIYDESLVKLSIVGTGIMGNSEVVALFFKTLYNLGINLEMISTSEIKISCIIDEEKSLKAMNELHRQFGLNKIEYENKVI